MRVMFLGTSAAEGWPAVFCQCANCRRARSAGGKNVRTRSSILVNNDLKIDFPPDTYHHVLKHGIELADVKNLLVTHTHQDHFYFEEFCMRLKPFAKLLNEEVLHVYGNTAVCNKIRELDSLTNGRLRSVVEAHVVEPFKEFRAGGYLVTPLIADHSEAEQCLIYVVSDWKTTVLHGYDSGWFPEETWRHLENFRLGLVILDCTHGPMPQVKYHMGIDGVLRVKDEMVRRGIADDETIFVATHFSHNGGSLHEELVERLKPENVEVAYDGLTIEL
jgi:phosphoribosyl 1,2-cyclic phosphate phosphodiesterase